MDLVKRLGGEAPEVTRFFVERVNEAFVVKRCYAIGDGATGGAMVAQAATALVPPTVGQAIKEGLERGRDAAKKKKRRAMAQERLRRIVFKIRKREALQAVNSYLDGGTVA